MPARAPLFGCIEAGGTKFMLGVAMGPEGMKDTTRIATGAPAVTLPAAIDWLRARPSLAGIGIASFGPVDPDPASPDWGRIADTPKKEWSCVDIAGAFARAFGVPLGFDTDVNGAALAEHRWGAARGDDVAVYVTVGTGIGGGAIVNGAPLHGRRHPEMGHILPPRHPADRDFPGVCPHHGACFEGLASGPSIIARWGAPLSRLPSDHPGHAIIGWYLGNLAVTIQAALAPRRIMMGGGVMATAGLTDRVQRFATALGRDYLEPLVVPPGLGDRSGLFGALALAMAASGVRR